MMNWHNFKWSPVKDGNVLSAFQNHSPTNMKPFDNSQAASKPPASPKNFNDQPSFQPTILKMTFLVEWWQLLRFSFWFLMGNQINHHMYRSKPLWPTTFNKVGPLVTPKIKLNHIKIITQKIQTQVLVRKQPLSQGQLALGPFSLLGSKIQSQTLWREPMSK